MLLNIPVQIWPCTSRNCCGARKIPKSVIVTSRGGRIDITLVSLRWPHLASTYTKPIFIGTALPITYTRTVPGFAMGHEHVRNMSENSKANHVRERAPHPDMTMIGTVLTCLYPVWGKGSNGLRKQHACQALPRNRVVPNLEVGKWISSIGNTKYPCVNVWGPWYEICAVESCIYFPFKFFYGGSSANLNERDKDLAYTGPF